MMALSKVKITLERVLDKNMQDLVRGIRNHSENEAKYIAECLDEIKAELRQENIAVKAMAVNKLIYLQLQGYDISWAAFNIIEVMSSTKFTHKRIGYLAASQSFHEGIDVLMLTTNMIRKDLNSQNLYDASLALNALSCFITPDLAKDLAQDIITLMTTNKHYVRKKAVLILYKVFLQFPEALRPAFPRLKDKLEDPDPGVQSAAVNVICELARKNPKNYLSLAPFFFKLMTTSTNNWVLIKIIKLFCALTPLEPRLGKKLIEPLINLIHSTSAMSLLYECVNTVLAVLISVSTGIPNHMASVQLCVQKLTILIEDADQNLKYLGLLAMSKILQTHPKSVQTHKDLILQCLDDKDESIRFRALDLLYGMISKKNLMEIVKKLMIHMDKAEGTKYRDELLAKIIEISSQSNYQYVTNFEWYVSILVELTRMESTRHGRLIADHMLDVVIRVQAIRPFAVAQMAVLLENAQLISNNSQRNGICEVLYAAAWLCGEFPDHLNDPKAVLESMLKPNVLMLPGHIQCVYIQNIIKLYANILKRAKKDEDKGIDKDIGNMLSEKLPIFIQSSDLEVQERACCMVQLVRYVIKLHDKGTGVAAIVEEVEALFSGDLNPVAAKAQKKVPVPEGLDLDTWINEPPAESSDDEVRHNTPAIFLVPGMEDNKLFYQNEPSKKVKELSEEELQKAREHRAAEHEHNPHYLKGDIKKGKGTEETTSGVPLTEVDLHVPLQVPGLISSDKYMQIEKTKRVSKKQSKKKKKRKQNGDDEDLEEENIAPQDLVSTVVEMPEGVTSVSDKEDDDGDVLYKKLNVNLDEPLKPDEILPVRTHRIVLGTLQPVENGTPKKEKHRNDKESRKVKKKRKEEHRQEKKNRSKKSKNITDDEPSKLIEDHEEIVEDNTPTTIPSEQATVGMEKGHHEKPSETNGDKMNDLEFWLSGNDAISQPLEKPEVFNTEERVKVIDKPEKLSVGVENKFKKKKEKKGKKGKKDGKHKKNKLMADGYEETEGIVSPSQELVLPSHLDNPVNAKPMTSYLLLAQNDRIKLTYETRVNHQRSDQIVVSIVFMNLTSNLINNLEFNVMDSLNTKLSRAMGHSTHDAVQVPFVLPAGVQNEGQFAFTVDSISQPTKMKGTLTYMVKTEQGLTHEKLDFRLQLSCSAFLVALPYKGADFSTLLSSGDLTEKSTLKCSTLDANFDVSLLRICFYSHFKVVEKVDNSASLYSRSIQGHHVCLLVKLIKDELTIDGKSTDGNLLANVLDDIKLCLTTELS